MNTEQKIQEKFEKVNKVFFEKESGANFLRVEINSKDLEEITNISKEISLYLDTLDVQEKEYFLDVYSLYMTPAGEMHFWGLIAFDR